MSTKSASNEALKILFETPPDKITVGQKQPVLKMWLVLKLWRNKNIKRWKYVLCLLNILIRPWTDLFEFLLCYAMQMPFKYLIIPTENIESWLIFSKTDFLCDQGLEVSNQRRNIFYDKRSDTWFFFILERNKQNSKKTNDTREEENNRLSMIVHILNMFKIDWRHTFVVCVYVRVYIDVLLIYITYFEYLFFSYCPVVLPLLSYGVLTSYFLFACINRTCVCLHTQN